MKTSAGSTPVPGTNKNKLVLNISLLLTMLKKTFILLWINLIISSQNIDSITSIISTETPSTQLEILAKETWQFRSKNPMYALECGQEALNLAVKLNDKAKEAEINNFIGVIHRNIGNYPQSLLFYNKALEIAKAINDSVQMAYSYNNIGGAYRLEQNYTLALTNMFKAIEIFEKLEMVEGIAFCTINIGIVYRFQGNYDKALDYFNRTIEIRENIGDIFGLAIAINQVIEVLYDKKEYNLALERYNDLLELYEELDDTKGIAAVYGGIGGIKYRTGDYPAAKEYREKALKLNEEIQNTETVLLNLHELSLIYLKLGENEKSQNALARAYDICKTRKTSVLAEHYNYKSSWYELSGRLDSALYYYKKYTHLKDSLAALENIQSIALMESVHQVDRAFQENKILQNENRLKDEQTKFLLILSIILTAFISFILYKFFQNRKLNKQLKELNATKDKFFSIIGHDLKNPFNNLLGYTQLLADDYETMTEEERKQSVINLNQSSKKLVILIDNLLQWARTNIGALKYSPKSINLFLFINNLISNHNESIVNKDLDVKIKIDPEMDILIDEDYLNLVTRNLLSNAIKFSNRNGRIDFIAEDKIDEVVVHIKDNGVGIEEDKLKKILDFGGDVSTPGTLNERGTGLGLILVNDLIRKWGGKISVHSKVGKGSTFSFTIPKTKQIP